MSVYEFVFIESFCLSIPALLLAAIAFFLAIIPRPYTRQVRHRMAGAVLWQWIKGSKVSAFVHTWLWRNGNGNGDKPEDLEKYL